MSLPIIATRVVYRQREELRQYGPMLMAMARTHRTSQSLPTIQSYLNSTLSLFLQISMATSSLFTITLVLY